MATNNTASLAMAEGTITRAVAIRLKPGMDLMKGLTEAAEKAGIKNGVIVSGMGSLDGVRFCNPVEIEGSPAGYGYDEPLTLRGPIELVAMSGVICHDDAGETNLHVHISVSDRYGNGYGGHLVEGTKILLTADIVMAELGGGINLNRKMDPELGVPICTPIQE